MAGHFRCRALTAEEVQQAVGWYVVDVMGLETIARRFGVTAGRVARSLEDVGVAIVPGRRGRTGAQRGAKLKPLGLPDDEIVRRYEAGETADQLALAAKCRPNRIVWRLRHYGVELRPPGGRRVVVGELLVQARRLYEQEGLPLDRIALRLSGDGLLIGERGVRRALARAGVKIRPSHAARTYWKLPDEEIVRRYLAGEDGQTLGKVLGCSPTTVYRLLKRFGVPRRAPGARKEAGPDGG